MGFVSLWFKAVCLLNWALSCPHPSICHWSLFLCSYTTYILTLHLPVPWAWWLHCTPSPSTQILLSVSPEQLRAEPQILAPSLLHGAPWAVTSSIHASISGSVVRIKWLISTLFLGSRCNNHELFCGWWAILLQCLRGSSGLGHFPAVFPIIVCGLGIALLLSDFFFSLLFLLLPTFMIARLPTLGHKHASVSIWTYSMARGGRSGQALPAVTAAPQSSAPSMPPGLSVRGTSRRTSCTASITFVPAKPLSSAGSHFPFPALILCPFKPELLLLLICIDCSLSNHPTLDGISTGFYYC